MVFGQLVAAKNQHKLVINYLVNYAAKAPGFKFSNLNKTA